MRAGSAAALRSDAAARTASVHIIQGEFRISGDPEVMFSTLLGSCVAACIRDPVAQVGGMNHFLLPGSSGHCGEGERYGVHAMEMLINGLLGKGADRRRLEVKLFGGAKTMKGLADIGDQNARFARSFVEAERLQLVGECLGGMRGRRVQFWPVSGRARRSFLSEAEQVQLPVKMVPVVADAGALELF